MLVARLRFHEIVYRWLHFIAYLLGLDSLFDRKFKLNDYTLVAMAISLLTLITNVWATYTANTNEDALVKGVHCFVGFKVKIQG